VRGLSLLAAIMIVIGSMLGSGIFRKPATMAGQLLSPELLLLVWIVAGIVSFIGALTNSEISGMIDETGGQYAYFRIMYGDFVAFLYGWATLSVIQTGSQAAIAYVFSEYLGYFFHYPHFSKGIEQIAVYMPLVGDIYPLKDFGTKAVAILCLGFLTFVNYIGVIFGGAVQTLITIVKIASIIILAFLILLLGNGTFANVYTGFNIPQQSHNIFSMIGLALAGAFWAYDGWNNVTYVSGEVKNPKRNVPLALLTGTFAVIVIYVLINIAFLYVLPINVMAKSPLVAASAAEFIFGPVGASIISIAVIISTFGALNGSILSTARVMFAMARTKLFFKSLGWVHDKYKTPHISLAVMGTWSGVLVLTGSFDIITDYVMFAAWLFYALGAYGVFVLRKKMPDAHRPYRVWGYPFTPAVFVIFSIVFLFNTLISETQNAKMGLVLIFSGVPLYFYMKWKSKNEKTKNEEAAVVSVEDK
ncbi:MAG: APC family permease, partial [Ignavibacteriales bacterium]